MFDGRDYMVGRKDCDISIKDDTSISRKHASLLVKVVIYTIGIYVMANVSTKSNILLFMFLERNNVYH